MRHLSKTVLAGGVVYPAGTPATDDLDDLIQNPDSWSEPLELEDPDHPNTLALREVVEYLAERHLAGREEPISALLAEAVEVFGEPAASTDPDQDSDPVPAENVQSTVDPGADPAVNANADGAPVIEPDVEPDTKSARKRTRS